MQLVIVDLFSMTRIISLFISPLPMMLPLGTSFTSSHLNRRAFTIPMYAGLERMFASIVDCVALSVLNEDFAYNVCMEESLKYNTGRN